MERKEHHKLEQSILDDVLRNLPKEPTSKYGSLFEAYQDGVISKRLFQAFLTESIRDFILQNFTPKEKVNQIRLLAFEEWCRWAVRRMAYWKKEDEKKSVDYREGVESACSDMCVYFRKRSSNDCSPYLERQAIETAITKCGMMWPSNRTRLDFYEYFETYIKERVEELLKQERKEPS